MQKLAGVLAGAVMFSVSLSAQEVPAEPLAAGAPIRVLAPRHFPSSGQGGYAGVRNDSLFVREARTTLVFPREFITRIDRQTMTARAGAIRGAWTTALAAGFFTALYASDGAQSALAVLPVTVLMGAGYGALRKGKTWVPLDIDAVMGADTLAAQQRAVVAAAPEAPLAVEPDTKTLPPGFFSEQMIAGARTGAIGAGVGLLAGVAVCAASQKSSDDLCLLGVPVMSALLGYLVATPLGVAKHSRERGIEGSLGRSYVGATLGIVGLAGGGVGFFFTVPFGAAKGYNSGR
jgi:hypothetical protein